MKDPNRIIIEEHDNETNAHRTISIDGFSLPPYDYIQASYPSGTQEVYEYRNGGETGIAVGTITVNYTDSTKSVLLSVIKT